MIGDQLFKEGTVIDGDVIARAKAAQGIYIKDSQKAVTNEMHKMSQDYRGIEEEIEERAANDPNSLTEDEKFYLKNKSDFNSFDNISEEFEGSIDEANQSIDAYNSEYGSKVEKIEANGSDFYSMIKDINGRMESGTDITDINKELAKSETEIERLERENENNRKNTTVTYYDEQGRKSKEPISLDDAKSRNKTRSENNKRKIEKHQQRRSLMMNMNGGKK